MRIQFFQILPVLLLLIISCGKNDHAHHDHEHDHHHEEDAGKSTEQPQPKNAVIDEETREMIGRVQHANANVNPDLITYYLNGQRVQSLKNQIATTTGLQQIEARFKYGYELLKSGQTKSSIKELESLLTDLEGQRDKIQAKTIYQLKGYLALAYMRLAEQENCIFNHTGASCIIPIQPEGQHQKTEGSTNAIRLYEEMLTENPEDYQAQYLLNIAYMTLGKYPNEVPKAYQMTQFVDNKDFPRFINKASELGLDVRELSGGVAMDDFNNDGLIDIVASSWGFNHQLKIFLNRGDSGFEEVSAQAGLSGVTGGLNIQHADYNNDGNLDLLILRGAWFNSQGKIPNSLLRNNGDGTFTDVTLSAGVYDEAPTQTASFVDLDLDGDLDLIYGNESSPNFPIVSKLFQNNGDGTFTDISRQVGIGNLGFVKAVTAGDINNDGFPELFFSRLNQPNLLLHNTTGSSGSISFTDITGYAGVSGPEASFPCWFFDFNNDGLEDIFVSGYLFGNNTAAHVLSESLNNKSLAFSSALYINNGDLKFTDITQQAGLNEPTFTMGCNYSDINNDGYLDFYLGTGEPNLNSIIPNKMYVNVDGKKVKDVTYSGGFGHIQKGHAIGFSDLDNDGDNDIYAVMGGAYDGDIFQNAYFENPINDQNWISLKLIGKTANHAAIGARIIVTITENGRKRNIYRTVSTGASFGGNSLRQTIGVGKAGYIDELTIIWPDLTRESVKVNNIPINTHYKFEQGGNLETLTLAPIKFQYKASNHQHHDH